MAFPPGHPHQARRRPWSGHDTAIAIGLASLVLLRWPLRSLHLATWDSVLFALGIERYDVFAARPHAPGYPVYILLGKLAAAVAPDANAALVALSVLFTAGAVATLYALLRHWTGRAWSLGGALLLATSPVALYNSLIATTYPAEALLSAGLALLAVRHLEAPSPRRAVALAAAFALGLGVRQSLLFFLAPLVAYALLAAREPLGAKARSIAMAFLACAAVVLAWLVPMAIMSGGLASYLAATRLQTSSVVFALTVFTHGAEAWADLWPRFLHYIRPELAILFPATGLALVALAPRAVAHLAGARSLEPRPPGPSRDATAPPVPATFAWTPLRTLGLVLAWGVPPLLFYLLVFNGWDKGPDGYMLVLLPAIYAACVLVLRAAGEAVPMALGRPVAATVLAVSLLGFLAAWPEHVDGRVRDHDQWTDAWLALAEDDRFAPSTAAIVASYSWAHVKWHYPDHVVWSMMRIPGPGGGAQGAWFLTMQTQHHDDDVGFYQAHIDGPTGRSHPIPIGIERIVLFDFQVAGENGGPRLLAPEVPVHEATLANGWRILYVDVDPARPHIEDYFTVRPNTATA